MSEYTEETAVKNNNRSANQSPLPFNSKSEISSGYASTSLTPNSPQSISPPHTLKRSRSSSFRLINRRISTISNSSQISIPTESSDRLAAFIGWYPAFLIRIFFELLGLFTFVVIRKLPFVLPTLWVSACLWLFWKSLMLPLSIIKSILILVFIPASERRRKKRTVLISGGSTVQSVHLARNYCSAGARIVVCEVDGNFGLARFSTAVSSYYTVPKPTEDSAEEYIDALKKIIVDESVSYYIPVSEANTAYYDALAKPHIESLGCQCICPDLRDILLLDDTLELMRKIQTENLAVPTYHVLQNYMDLKRAYEYGTIRNEPHTLVSVGLAGCKKRQKIHVPSKRHIRVPQPINEQNPWLLMQDYEGENCITCTTVRDSQVIANVTCKVDDFGGLVPIQNEEIELWLRQFFASLKFNRKIIGHLSFFFTITDNGVLPMGCQVGIRKPFILYTNVQSRLVCKPCKHFSRHKSGPIVANDGKYWLNEAMLNTIEYPSVRSFTKLFDIICGKHEALFTIWDPLPYCAYYYIQLPITNVSNIFRRNAS
ncbi:uncharacterized protein LOC135841290 [Planococcus citri]|uniref:uncharacterized protein LOC135841290 n=1 Tax=Planococcus citri TaxID=170843 RepID=UPI0031F807DC